MPGLHLGGDQAQPESQCDGGISQRGHGEVHPAQVGAGAAAWHDGDWGLGGLGGGPVELQ